ncbi:trypsin-like serine protease [Pseudomonas sp. DP16D-R1]|uniref:trypsin-like serine protease n=1 Tax=Pseudomonas sp. DP16D-R1 TaxID=2075551 RepID=UPI001304A2C4|nr:trypsin-like serine protease [Pseudomonas sp. DP16D-R1]
MNALKWIALGTMGVILTANGQATVMGWATVDRGADILVRGGDQASPSEFTETVVVEFKSASEQAYCSGVLVGTNAVLTAAHCGYRKLVPVRVTAATNLSQALKLGAGGYARQPSTGVPQVQSAAVASFAVMDPSAVAQGRNLGGLDLMVMRSCRDKGKLGQYICNYMILLVFLSSFHTNKKHDSASSAMVIGPS